MRVDVAARSRLTEAPTVTWPSRFAIWVSSRGEPGDTGQVGPLVLVRLESGQVEEDGCAAAPALSLQRGGDKVPQAPGLQDVLGREQPVVAGQVHPSSQGDRLAQQPGADLTGGGCGNGRGEKEPRVRACG